MLKRILFLIAILFAAGSAAFAQVTTSVLSGNVRDSSGSPLAGASIVARHIPSGTIYTATSQSNGQYSIANMRPGGPYSVQISYVGFETERTDELYLKLAETFVLNSIMIPGATTLQGVVITGARRNNLLNANRTGAVTNVGSREIQRLPTVTRSLNDFTRLTPQANGSSIGGGNYRQNNITIDGGDFNNTFGIGGNLPANGAPISLDAIDEISVSVSPFDIRQSGFIGSAINAVTRSGTNTFTGSVYHYFYNQNQRGNKVKNTEFTRVPTNFKQYGARIGGPIIKNKLFFFASYETEKQPKQIQTRFAATAAAPYQSAPNISRPTATELTAISDYLRNTYGYNTGPFDNYNTEIERTKILARLDWNITAKHRFNIRYNQVEGFEPNPPSTSRSPFSQFANTNNEGRQFISAQYFKNSSYYQDANFYSLAAELNSQFGKVSNTLRGTYTKQDDSRSSDSQDFPFVDILKDGLPFTSFGYEPFSKGNIRLVKTYSIIDYLTWTTKKHNWTLGGQADFSTTTNGFQRFATSYYTFNSFEDFTNGVNPIEFGLTYSLAPGFAQAFPQFKWAQYSLYGQDEIAFNNRFRLTLGLRFDLPTFPEPLKEHPLISALTFANGEKVNTGDLPKAALLWSPRLGFNWDFYGDRSLQFRGGTGLFTGKIPFVWIVSQAGDAGMLQVTQTWSGATVPGPFNPDPGAYLPSTVPVAGTVIPNPISVMGRDFKMPQTWKTSLALDKRLPWNMVFTLEGIFNRDIRTAVYQNINLVAPTALNASGYPDRRVIYPVANNVKFINPLLNGQAVPNGTANGGAFNVIRLTNGYKGYYASLTAKLDKQFTRGFFATVAYTKSVADNLYDGGGDQPLSAWQGTASVNGSNFPTLGYAGFVVPDRVVATISYRHEYVKALATTVTLFYTGSIDGRFSYIYGNDFNNDGNTNDLIYIPKDASEITFTDFTYPNGVTYTAAQQSELFFKYVEQDKYLRRHKGQYAERNGGRYPWRNQVDFKFLQDIFVKTGRSRNTLQFSMDILNFGNLLNRNWGTVKTVNASSLLVGTNTASIVPGGTVRPTFRLQTDRNAPVTSTFRDVLSTASTYSIQFGLRYLFN